ncbi:nuclear transport factor 2 family protein [Alteromonas lipotrueiana]|uniref:nuclear transport factor 2 family protein n=1 Tax=Alteromonas lipotrueiana TaxID=2803815 RepID=UPI001C492F17|nr:nuclear transport factor 2 family protein [Alteromonas lipotrueiana]
MLVRSIKLAALAMSLLVSAKVLAHEFGSPQDAVNSYISAVKTGSGEHIKMAFLPSASIQYYDKNGKYQNYTRDDFAKLVDTGNKWNATIEITDLKTTGNAANATVEFSWGDEGKQGYVDYLNLINHDGSWHITDKVAQYVER